MIFNTLGQIVRLHITPDNVDDRISVRDMMLGLKARLIGDKDYLSQDLFDDLFKAGTTLITKVRENMKNKIMLSKRPFVETIFSSLKSLKTLIHQRHRCPFNAFAHLIAGFIIYQLRDDKPSLNF